MPRARVVRARFKGRSFPLPAPRVLDRCERATAMSSRFCVSRALLLKKTSHACVEDTRALMRETHVVVQTSAWEGQPVAIQEAIGEGAAIIATDAGGTRWVTGERIPLVAPANARELAERLIAFVPGHPGSEERLGELRAASRARAAELPTEEDLIAQLESALFTFTDDEKNQHS